MIELKGQITHTRNLQGSVYATPGRTGGTETYLLITEDGHEIPAVAVGEETIFTATANDIRLGTVAATASGVTEGTKVIPSYHTTEGYELIPSGSAFIIPFFDNLYDFTKLQVVICPWNESIAESVAAEKVSLDENVYAVNSAESLASVTRDSENLSINLNITNESDSLYVVRYFTYKEIA